MNKILNVIFLIFLSTILFLSLRGVSGNPTDLSLNSDKFKDVGPLELSPDRGRFALTYSIVEHKSFQFTLPVARFVTPDLAFKDGNFVSLFAPGISLLVIPGYIVGKYYGAAQVGTFAIVSIVAIFNAFLIKSLSKRVGASTAASYLAALTFLFATSAYAYAVTLYQHQVTVLLILLSVYILDRYKKSIYSLIPVWFLVVFSILVDYPNFFFLFPVGLWASSRLINVQKFKSRIKLQLKLVSVLTLATAIIPILIFFWVNFSSYGDPFQLAGTLPSVKEIDQNGVPLFEKGIEISENQNADNIRKKTATGFFRTRNMLNSFYILTISPDRGFLVFSPAIALGLIGISTAIRNNKNLSLVLLSVAGTNFFLYTMWGDAWGGWAFGTRYLIPYFAVLSIFLSAALTKYSKNFIFLAIFLILFVYSAGVNTLGALTTNRNPPKIEAVALEAISGRDEKYSYDRNWEFLRSGKSKSFVYGKYLADVMSSTTYFFILLSIIASSSIVGIFYLRKQQ